MNGTDDSQNICNILVCNKETENTLTNAFTAKATRRSGKNPLQSILQKGGVEPRASVRRSHPYRSRRRREGDEVWHNGGVAFGEDLEL